MRSVYLASTLLLATSASASALVAAPSNEILDVTFAGDCQGTPTHTRAKDGEETRIKFLDLGLSAAAGDHDATASLSCLVTLTLDVPEGFRAGIPQLEIRGHAGVAAGGEADVLVRRGAVGDPLQVAFRSLEQGERGGFELASPDDILWLGCGERRPEVPVVFDLSAFQAAARDDAGSETFARVEELRVGAILYRRCAG